MTYTQIVSMQRKRNNIKTLRENLDHAYTINYGQADILKTREVQLLRNPGFMLSCAI